MAGDNDDVREGVGDRIIALRSNWSFDGDTVDNFGSHVRRSIPLYDLGHDLVCQLSDFFVHSGSTCYEIGVSTGELIRRLADYNAHKSDVRWVGLDSAEGMIHRAREHTAGYGNIELLPDDATAFEFKKTDFVVSYYCIQFIPPRLRQPLFDKIYESLHWGGAFVMFEKVRAPDARFQDIAVALYDDFKRGQGFDDSEILGKARSLRGVLEPYTTEANRDYLRRAGFQDILSVMKYVCFEGFLAIK